MNEGIFILILLFLLFSGVMGFLYLKTDYYCDVGELSVAGDYKTEPNTFFNNRFCAIKDCAAVNNYYNETRCVV